MAKPHTLQTLLQGELQDIYDAENRLVKALPKMAKAATTEKLRAAFQEHLEVTKGHVERLKEVFDQFGLPAKAKTCNGMKGLVEEGEEVISEEAGSRIGDVALIGAAQRVEHYEIAAYGTVRAMAEQLENTRAAGLLKETLEEEKEADEKLNEIAQEIYSMIGEGSQDQGVSGEATGSRGKSPKTRTSSGT